MALSWLATDASCGLTAAGDQPGTDPRLGPLQNNGGRTATHALLSGSPAIDTANAAACPATDQRGVVRPQGAGCDIGAYEAQPVVQTDLSLTKADSPDPVIAGENLTYTLTARNAGPSAATGVTVVDTLPANVTFQSATSTVGTCSPSAGTVTCTIGALASGATDRRHNDHGRNAEQ